MHGVVFELPEAADVAAQHIAEAGLASRLEARGGDLARDDIGTGYDLIWCSSVLHFVPELSACLAKLHAALKPGGELICVHAEIPDRTRGGPPHALLLPAAAVAGASSDPGR